MTAAAPDNTLNNTPDNIPDDTPKSEEDKGLSGGAIVGIVLGSVSTAGIGTFAVIWFVIKKKSFADLLAIFKKK